MRDDESKEAEQGNDDVDMLGGCDGGCVDNDFDAGDDGGCIT